MSVALRSPTDLARWAVPGAAAVAGGVLASAPTGVRPLDAVWCGAFVALLAALGRRMSPAALLPAAAAAALLAGSQRSLVLAVAAVLLAVAATVRARPPAALTAMAAGLIGLSLLQGSGPDTRILAAITTTGVAGGLVLVGVWGLAPPARRRLLLWSLGGLGALVVLAGLGGVAAGLASRDADRGIDALRAAQRAGAGGDLQGTVDDAGAAARAFRSAGRPLVSFGRLARIVPVLSQQLAAAETAVDTAGDAAEALHRAGTSVDLDGIGVQDGGVDLARLAAAEPALHTLSDTTARAVLRLAGIDRSLLVRPVSDALDDALGEARQAAVTADRVHRAVQTIPPLLGGGRPTRYLLLFTSPDEARNRFGFPGAFAVLRFDAGRMSFERSGPITVLDNPQTHIDQAPLSIPERALPYLPYGISRAWRSVTIAPDGPTVATMALQLAAQAGLGPLDGVVLADPTALAGVVGLVGDVPVPGLGVTLTEATTVDFLTRRQYLEFPELGQQADRKDLLSGVADEVGRRLAAFSAPQARAVLDTFGPLVAEGHLVLSVPASRQPAAARLFADVGLDGGFPRSADAGTDLLYVGQRNYAGNKIDLFLERSLQYDVTVARDGAVRADLTIDLTNTAPASGLPPYLIGALAQPPPPSGTNLTTTILYSRHELASLTVDGVPVSPVVTSDGGLLVYQVDVELGPGQRRTIEAHLTGTADSGPYAVMAYPGGLVHPDALSLSVRDARDGGRLAEDLTVVRPTCRATTAGRSACHRGAGSTSSP